MIGKNIIFDFKKINSMDDFYGMCKAKFALPEYFGNNLDALYDCLTGYLELPVNIDFINISKHQTNIFHKLIQTFEDAQKELGEEFVFRINNITGRYKI